MTLLELIGKAATGANPSEFPITFNPDKILPNLKPEPEEPDNRFNLVEPLIGFKISDSNSDIADSNSGFFKKLKQRLNATDSLSSAGFADMLVHFLEQIRSLVPVDGNNGKQSSDGKQSVEAYAQKLFESVGGYVSRDVIGLVIEACVSTGVWGVLETLICKKLVVGQGLQSALLSKLIEKKRSDLVCLFAKCFSDDLNWSDLLGILKYFLSPSNEARVNMASIRKGWEEEALLAVKKAGDKKLDDKKQEAAILLMVAYDGFSAPELCLHYLLSSTKVDDMVFSGAISKLNLDEILDLIRYLGKWLSKYERFPQAIPCPILDACRWVPTLEAVADALGVVVDEWFSSLVLHSEFHQELKSVEGVLSSLVVEGRLCGSVASLIDISKAQG